MKNKYQETLNELQQLSASKRQNELYDTLQELVDKETPMKPNLKSTGTYFCNKCSWRVGNKADLWNPYTYCRKCGQKIDWSKDND